VPAVGAYPASVVVEREEETMKVINRISLRLADVFMR
jgi:hypothetical protein